MLFRRILVVDDEAIQREVLAEIVKGIVPEAEVIVSCDGEDAWRICQEYQGELELILTDINMPVLDGVGLIRRVSEQYPEIKMVFISAYQEFEYARNAIRYGVREYLLKPFRIQTARELLERMNEELEGELAEKRKRGLAESILEDKETRKQLHELFLERRGAEELDGGIRGRFPGEGSVAVIRWKLSPGTWNPRYCAQITVRQQDMLLDSLKRVFPDTCFLMEEHGLDETEHRMIMLQTQTAESVTERLTALLAEGKEKGIIFWAGVSEDKQELLKEIADAFRQAEEALSFYFYVPEEGGIFTWNAMHMALEKSMISTSNYEKELKAAVQNGDEKGQKESLKKMEKTLSGEGWVFPAKIRHRISSLIVSVLREMEGVLSQQEYDLFLNEAYEAYGKCDSFRQLFDISEEILRKLTVRLKNRTEDFDAVDQCIAYIKSHIQEELSLQTLADSVHFHPTYLSARIKERVGMGYSSFLLSVRMDQARRMLTETDWKVLEVAQKCGFRDSSYFNRIFRRECGMSPEQYRKVHRPC